MAIECARRIDYLDSQCRELGLEVKQAGNKLRKDDYVRALRNHFLLEKYGSIHNIPWSMKFMLTIECLQLCRRMQTLKESDQQKIWESNDWIAEEKLDGCRMALLWDADEKQFHFFSRNNSMVDYLPQDYKDTIYITADNFDYDKNFVLDTEVISTSPNIETNDTQCLTQLQSTSALLALNPDDSIAIQRNDPLKFIVFDCLYHDESYMDKPWIERHKQAELLCDILKEYNFNCELNPVIENTEYNKNKKREFFDELIDNQKEGIVLKNKYAKYHATSSRTIDCVKVKRSTSDSLTNDIDAFITDYVVGNDDTRNENMVVGFIFSVRLEKEDGTIVNHKIAVCSNISDYIKDDATVIDDNGNVSLNNDYYFRVATLKGQNISARNMRLTHAIIEMWRPDRSADTCEVLKESSLRELIF